MKTAGIIIAATACIGLSGIAGAQTRPSSVRGHSPAIGTPAGQTTGRSARTIRASSGGGKPHAPRTMKNGGQPMPTAQGKAGSAKGRR